MTERIAKDPPLGQEPVRSPRPVRRDGNPALSFAQQRLWFLDQFEPNNSVYNVPIGLRLRGPLNVASLERSLNEIVRRHEALRTTFPAIEGQPFQLISESLALSLPVQISPTSLQANGKTRLCDWLTKRLNGPST
jgi:Condensation domain